MVGRAPSDGGPRKIINPIYTPYITFLYLLAISPLFLALQHGGLKQPRVAPKGFPAFSLHKAEDFDHVGRGGGLVWMDGFGGWWIRF